MSSARKRKQKSWPDSGRVLILGTSLRHNGSMGLAANLHRPRETRNRARFFQSLDIPASRAVRAELVHGTRVAAISVIPRRGFVAGTDALVTKRPNTFLWILTSDCFPVFFWDRQFRAVGVAHAGWHGVVGGIVPKTIRALRKAYAVEARDIHVRVGPGIRSCHFEIWPKTRHRGIARFLPAYKKYVRRAGAKIFFDLAGVVTYQLRRCGVSKKHISTSRDCTYHLPRKYFSYRRSSIKKSPRSGNMLSVIGIRAS